MKNNKYIILLISLIVLLSSCEERIDFEVDTSFERIVVEGAITNKLKRHQIMISKTSDYFENTPAPKVENASVIIRTETREHVLSEVEPGIYETEEIIGEPGVTYNLEIDTEGEIYNASATMPEITDLDSIYTNYEEDYEVYLTGLYFQDPDNQNYYMINMYRNDTLLTDSINNFLIMDDVLYNGIYLYGYEIYTEDTIQQFDEITIELASIEKSHYDFIQSFQAETEGKDPMFSGPPANIKGNISNGGIGYFAAYSSSRASQIYIRE